MDWPVNIGGKSVSALPALIPITFEITVLFAAVGTVIAFFLRARLWPGKCHVPLDPRITDDRFILVLEARDQDIAQTRKLLLDLGAEETRELEVAP